MYDSYSKCCACSFKQYVEQRPASDLMTPEEQASITSSLEAAQKSQEAAAQPAESAEVKAEGTEAGNPPNGETEAKPEVQDSDGAGESPDVKAEASESVSEADVKAHWLTGVDALYKVSNGNCRTFGMPCCEYCQPPSSFPLVFCRNHLSLQGLGLPDRHSDTETWLLLVAGHKRGAGEAQAVRGRHQAPLLPRQTAGPQPAGRLEQLHRLRAREWRRGHHRPPV